MPKHHIDLKLIDKQHRNSWSMDIGYDFAQTRFGRALFLKTDNRLCGLSFCLDNTGAPVSDADALTQAKRHYPDAAFVKNPAAARYADSIETQTLPPMLVSGTAFQCAVWHALCAIPKGHTSSYGEIAAKIGKPKAAIAVGQANADNRIAYFIPCHRVTAHDGRLHGYAYGLACKRSMLEFEAKQA